MTISNTSSIPSHSHVYFRYQSHNIPFTVWVKLITVCLAPLITHIAFGYGTSVMLYKQQRPRLLDRLTQFNPIAIVWRYHAIVNRRIRAKDWDRADMAASNAIFWDGTRWDGSEKLMLQSRQWVVELPEQSRVEWVSSSMLATVAMAMQGIGALVQLLQTIGEKSDWDLPGPGLTDIFNYLAILSLARLPASLWLSEEYGFNVTRQYRRPVSNLEDVSEPIVESVGLTYFSPPKIVGQVGVFEPEMADITPNSVEQSRLWSNSAYGARLWNFFSIAGALTAAGLGAYISICNLGPRAFLVIVQLSGLGLSLYYLVLSLSAPLIFITYILKGQSGNTALPCMNAMWFKWLNVAMILLAILMFVTSALETTISPTGRIITYPLPPE